ncbi:phage tail tape measure protein [Pseudomonas putida]|uniref:Phage tail protein n=1 Tax=Pseudomonas putida TaxID=303 RepID=A0A177SRT9_PSEPU|nr:phage tail tape measure protein [Pseudomonas putida]OAI93519.1 phage tail protein [Pseudomonas putida]
MASRLNLSLVIGGAVASSLGSAFKTAESGIAQLEQKGNKARVLKGMIGETVKLREEWKKAHDSGSSSASGLLRKLESNLDALRKQGVQVGRLDREYQRLGRTARATDLQIKGRQQLTAGKEGLKSTAAQATAGVAAVAIPTAISAGYQATMRDIAIKAGVANQPEEQAMSKRIIQVAQDNGMSNAGVADLVNQLVGAGMDLKRALSYADVAAKFSVGQGASGDDTAKMIMSMEQNAKITDPEQMTKALEGVALQGQAGSFEASDMARWFPVLLAGMEKTGSVGPEAVAQLGAMLQVQMKTAGSSDEAANNLKNWIEKIGSGEVVDAYKKAGIDYQASLTTGIQKGMSVLESSMALAMQYVQKTDPAKAKKMAEAQAKIDKEVDPSKALKMLDALEQSLRTGDIFNDMQVKAALTAYGQNRGLYQQLKKDAMGDEASGILDKNLAERRETSKQKWLETANAFDDAMRSVGDALRPFTDWAASSVTVLARGFSKLSSESQSVVAGIGALAAGFVALKGVINSYRVGKGLIDLGRGKTLERLADRGGKTVAEGGAGRRTVPTGSAPAVEKPGLLGRFRKTSSSPVGEPLANAPETQKVFVVNAAAIGRTVQGGGGPESSRRQRRRAKRQERAQARRSPSRARSVPDAPKPVSLPSSRWAGLVKGARNVAGAGKRLPGVNLIDAGLGAIDVALNAETQDEKAEGYGGVAGNLAGSAAGAVAGAALGSVVPVIGTAIGGLVGAIVGGMGGELGGAWLGKALFGEKEPLKTTVADKAATVAAPGDVVRAITETAPPPAVAPNISAAPAAVKPEPAKVDQSFVFSPSIPVTVQGDAKDPARVAQEIWPHIQRQMQDFARQAQARQLSDEPHV